MRKNFVYVLLFISVFVSGALSIHRSGQAKLNGFGQVHGSSPHPGDLSDHGNPADPMIKE